MPGFLTMLMHAEISYTESEAQRIRAHLEDLLESPAFAGSRRRQAFLRYVVEESLAGRGPSIKETTIAVDVFGRSPDFNAQSASIVRVTGGEVRKRLAQAYEAGLAADVRIDLPVGGYQPSFHVDGDVQAVEIAPPSEEVLPVEPAPVRHSWWRHGWGKGWRDWWVLGATGVGFTALALLLLPPAGTSRDPIDQLWQPYLNEERPVLISLQSPTLLYIPNAKKWLPLRPGEKIPTEEIESKEASYVGTGAALGAALFAEQLASRHQHFVLKFGGDVSFADMKNSPTILIGASRWAREFTLPLRFRLTAEGTRMTIQDTQDPSRKWEMERGRDSSVVSEGYSLVTRLLPAESGLPVLLLIGMDPRNTQAAVEFLTHKEAIAAFAASAPRDWSKRNFQVVLHSTIHGNSPGSTRVVASHVW